MLRAALVLLVAAGTTGVADARPRANNMPRGWSWPPSRTMAAAAKACEA